MFDEVFVMVKTVNASPIICALKGLIAAAVSSVSLLLILGIVLSKSDDPDAYIYIAPKIIQGISALVGGFVSSRFAEKNLFSSVVFGIMFSLIITFTALISGGNALLALIMPIISIVLSILGGIIGIPKAKSSMSAKRTMMKKIKNI